MRRPLMSFPVLLAFTLGCGARAVPGDGDFDDDAEVETPPARGQGGGTSSGGGSLPAGRPAPLDLPGRTVACEPGFRPSGQNGRRCRYTYEGLCYDDRDVACACACPGELCVIAGKQRPSNNPIAIVCQARP